MSSALKYIAIGGGVLVGVLLLKKALAPTPPGTTTAQGLQSIGLGLKAIGAAIGGGSSSSTSSTSGLTHEDLNGSHTRIGSTSPIGLLGGSQIAAYAAATGDGDAAIADGRNTKPIGFANPQPTALSTWEQRSLVGAQPNTNLYTPAPSRLYGMN
jgi:hypothetical protein